MNTVPYGLFLPTVSPTYSVSMDIDHSLENFSDKSYQVLEVIGEGAYGIVWYSISWTCRMSSLSSLPQLSGT